MKRLFGWFAFLCLAVSQSGQCAEPVALTWRADSPEDLLILSGVQIPSAASGDFEQFNKALKTLGIDFDTRAVQVMIPEGGTSGPRLPRFPYWAATLFLSVTAVDREVTYLYLGKPVPRYRIRCSNKGAGMGTENYWMNGEFFGSWETARERFLQFQWEGPAVIDILFEDRDFLSNKGIPLGLPAELEKLARQYKMLINQHRINRKSGDD